MSEDHNQFECRSVGNSRPPVMLQGMAAGGQVGASGIPPSSDAGVYLQLIRRNATQLIVTALLALFLAGFWMLSVDPVYQTSALLRIEDETSFMDKLLEKESDPFSTAPLAKEESKVITSRAVLGAAVDQLGLTVETRPLRFPLLGKPVSKIPLLASWIRKLFPNNGYAWDGERLSVSNLNLPSDLQGKPLTLVAGERGTYHLEFEGEAVLDQGEIDKPEPLHLADGREASITVKKIDAPPGTRFQVIQLSREASIQHLREALTINAREHGTRVMALALKGKDPVQLSRTLNEIVDTYRNLRLDWSSREVHQELAFLKAQLPEAQQKLKAAEQALADYRITHRSLDAATEVRDAISRASRTEAKLKSLKLKRNQLAKQYTQYYPEVEKLAVEIAATQRLLSQNRRKMQKMPEIGKALVSLERAVKMHADLYSSLEQRYQKLSVAEASSIGSVRLIDRAVAPEKPVWPRPAVIAPLAVLVAVFAHLIWLFLRMAMSNRVKNAEMVEKLSGAPVYVDVPYSSLQKPAITRGKRRLSSGKPRSRVLALEHPDDFAVETLRGLRAMLVNSLPKAAGGMLMICGPLPRMGKSFISSNLAVLLAESGKRILLIDGDFNRGQLHRDFGVANNPGLTEVMEGATDPRQAIYATTIVGLDLMPNGSGRPPNDFMLEQGLQDLSAGLSEQYDHVIIDAPPVLSLSTSAIIGRVAAATMMVVRTDQVTVDELKSAVKRLKLAGVSISGCLINNMNRNSQRQAYRYGYA